MDFLFPIFSDFVVGLFTAIFGLLQGFATETIDSGLGIFMDGLLGNLAG